MFLFPKSVNIKNDPVESNSWIGTKKNVILAL